jgi:hypothetical protein
MKARLISFDRTEANPQSRERRPTQPDQSDPTDLTDPAKTANPQSAIRNPQS